MKNNLYHIDVTSEEDQLFRYNSKKKEIKKPKPISTNFGIILGVVFTAHLLCAAAVYGIAFPKTSDEQTVNNRQHIIEKPNNINSSVASAKQNLASTNGQNSSKNNTKTSSTKEYTIKRGDTLYSISKKHHITVLKLMELNKIKNPNNLQIGQKLKFM